VRGRREVTKKVQSYVAAANLSVILRALLGMGTPRGLQSRLRGALAAILFVCRFLCARFASYSRFLTGKSLVGDDRRSIAFNHVSSCLWIRKRAYATGC
jgi:hypothetical protein